MFLAEASTFNNLHELLIECLTHHRWPTNPHLVDIFATGKSLVNELFIPSGLILVRKSLNELEITNTVSFTILVKGSQ